MLTRPTFTVQRPPDPHFAFSVKRMEAPTPGLNVDEAFDVGSFTVDPERLFDAVADDVRSVRSDTRVVGRYTKSAIPILTPRIDFGLGQTAVKVFEPRRAGRPIDGEVKIVKQLASPEEVRRDEGRERLRRLGEG